MPLAPVVSVPQDQASPARRRVDRPRPRGGSPRRPQEPAEMAEERGPNSSNHVCPMGGIRDLIPDTPDPTLTNAPYRHGEVLNLEPGPCPPNRLLQAGVP